MTTQKIIMHVDMDAFFVSVEEVLNPHLIGKPVIVGGDPDGRGVVASASYKARERGVRSAMPLGEAKRICPGAIFLRGSLRVYAEFSDRIMKILRSYTPAVEPVSVDEAYLDITGCLKLHKAGPVAVAKRIYDEIWAKVGVRCSIGIASGKVTAKIATNAAKPGGVLFVRPGYDSRFLAPLPIGKLPGVGPQTERQYLRMGVKVIGDLARFSPESLEKVFGEKQASRLIRRAKGEGGSEVSSSYIPAKSISRETTYSRDVADIEVVKASLSYLSEKVGAKVRREGFLFRRVTVKLRLADFTTNTKSLVITNPVCDTPVIYRTAIELLLAGLYKHGDSVRLVGVGVSLFSEPSRQVFLFEDSIRLARERLTYGVDIAREKFGFESVMTARSLLTLLP